LDVTEGVVYRSADGAVAPASATSLQQWALILLRTLIGWHFLYEGYYKWTLPGWDAAGQPLGEWTARGYLAAANGPFSDLFQRLAASPLIGWVDGLVIAALLVAGLSLMLGLFTQLGAWTALVLLSLFYLAQVPLAGRVLPGAEGAYLLVNKTLIEGAGVLTVLLFRTGRMAGLDVLRARLARIDTASASATDRSSLKGESHGAHA
jgi:thiosulfate dehydrogenase (quinone) large subunit